MNSFFKIITLLTILSFLFISPVFAGDTSTQYGPKSPKELEDFLDAFVEKEMEKNHIPGFMVSFVEQNRLLLNKGYGYADIEAKKPVNPPLTVFGVASVSKLFTAAAVLQLAEQGKINLDKEVNEYLNGFQIKNGFKEKITVRHLVLHTAGFEEYFRKISARKMEDTLSLEEYVRDLQPRVVYKPGAIYSYSNYSYTLMGYIVEQVSGLSYEEYVLKNIFTPLEMTNSSFHKELPDHIKRNLAKNYKYDDKAKKYKEIPGSYWNSYPGASLVTTTDDLSRFMIALLNDGHYKHLSILKPETVRLMQGRAFTPHENIPGQAYGFAIGGNHNGHHVIEKTGGGGGWAGHLMLFPEYNQGIAFCYNKEDEAFRADFLRAFLNKFYPDKTVRKDKITLSAEKLKKYAGFYRYSRHNHSGLEKLMTMISPQYNARIKVNNDGTISVGLMFVPTFMKYEPVGNNTFQKAAGEKPLDAGGMKLDFGQLVAFGEDGKKSINYFFAPYENIACKKISWFEYGLTQIIVMLIFCLFSLLFLIWWPMGALIKAFSKKQEKTISPKQKYADWSGILSALLILCFTVIMFTNFNLSIIFGIPPAIKIGLALPLIILILTPPVFVFVVFAWREGYWKIAGRILYSLFSLSLILFLIWAAYFNLIGWHY